MRKEHVAIVRSGVAARLLSGEKTIESRFTRTRRPPFDSVSVGDVIHFKVSGGDVIGTSRVRRLVRYADLTPTRLRSLERRYGRRLATTPAYWTQRRDCRFGVLIWLTPLRPAVTPPAIPRQFGNAWVEVSR